MTPDVDPEMVRASEELIAAVTPPTGLPEPGESAVIALRYPMVASLFFDRVWSFGKLPQSVQLYSGQELEQQLHLWITLKLQIDRFAASEVVDEEKLSRFADSMLEQWVDVIRNRQIAIPGDTEEVLQQKLERTISKILYTEAGISVPELYGSQSTYE